MKIKTDIIESIIIKYENIIQNIIILILLTSLVLLLQEYFSVLKDLQNIQDQIIKDPELMSKLERIYELNEKRKNLFKRK